MGFIREPIGIDFIIQSNPLNDIERLEISEYITSKKKQNKKAIPKKSVIDNTRSIQQWIKMKL